MTREEAIEYLNTLYMALAVFPNQQISLGNVDKMKESVDMAIKALEQEPCEDAISRQAVLDINENHHGQMPNHINHQIWQEIKDLPSVTPQPKMGRWIGCDILQEFKCSECRVCFRNKSNYCPNCGAKMQEVTE